MEGARERRIQAFEQVRCSARCLWSQLLCTSSSLRLFKPTLWFLQRSLRGLLEPVGVEDQPQPWTDLRLSLFTNRSDRFPIVKAGEFRSGAPLALGAHGLHKHQDKHHRQEGCGTHDCGCESLQLHLTATTSCLSTWGTNVSWGRILLRRREEETGRISVLRQRCLRKGSSENELQWLPCPA